MTVHDNFSQPAAAHWAAPQLSAGLARVTTLSHHQAASTLTRLTAPCARHGACQTAGSKSSDFAIGSSSLSTQARHAHFIAGARRGSGREPAAHRAAARLGGAAAPAAERGVQGAHRGHPAEAVGAGGAPAACVPPGGCAGRALCGVHRRHRKCVFCGFCCCCCDWHAWRLQRSSAPAPVHVRCSSLRLFWCSCVALCL